MEQDYEKLMGLVEEVQSILAQGSSLQELKFPGKPKGKSKNVHNPFRGLKAGKKIIGKSGAKGFGHRTVARKGKWACKCANYWCGCRSADGTKKTVRIDRAYKKKYNDAYRKWRSSPAGQRTFKSKASAFKPKN